MMKERILVTALCLSLLSVGWAQAQGASKIRRNGPHLRIDKSRIPAMSSNRSVATRSQRSTVRAPRPALRAGSGDLRRPGTSGTRGLPGNNRGSFPGIGNRGSGNDNPLGGLLQQYLYNELGGDRRYDRHAAENAHAEAYRDAAIANAVVNVIGILATTQQRQELGACPPAATGPRGHVERQRVLVQEGRTEEYQVWVPEHTIPETGETVAGHHETRRREIAPVYEIREVWVPAR